MPIDKRELAAFERKLRELHAGFCGDVGRLHSESADLSQAREGVDDDTAILYACEDLTIRLLERRQYMGDDIVDALERIYDGSYGRCQACNAWIPKARLQAIPYARYCLECADSHIASEHVPFDREREEATADAALTDDDDY